MLRIRGLHDTSTQHFRIQWRNIGRSHYRDMYYSYPVFENNDIVIFAKMAPQLRELRLTIERYTGNFAERLLYEALELFPHLQSLIVDLHYRPRSSEALWPTGPEPRSTHTSETYRSALVDAFMNTAMDEDLSLQIWNAIYAKRQKESLPKFRNLLLVPIGGDLFDNFAEQNVMFQLSRPFLISNREFGKSNPEICEIGRGERLLHVKRGASINLEPEGRHAPKRLQPIIKSLWKLFDFEMED
ncbi:hypothetical protein TSTA_048210 [Talaromyces stipitatus ATCC 10500]|uniref:Uncharacterized protein n=1 Tax=Talaromyces stipitatus (strain ATCC 10500 / CBS 375.48 / QM 6759 / NRRL 1006) TaxID=441959 RepID=B8MKM3_TALSN|nr:uncharacterized protein TSTA_048210 [Talaromyces stipitatus ATCC 10500]EED15378.1 hypothetical protein TSTA_048210 [Talaromyces stipitatus ATCC 10500]